MNVPSPCVNICQLDGNSCLGCGRTVDEIARWPQMTEIEKFRVVAALAGRSAELQLCANRKLAELELRPPNRDP